MPANEIDILVVDDIASQGEIVEGHINERSGYQGIPARSIQELVRSMLFGVYEGAMIDVIWDEWDAPVTLAGREIHDGIELAEVLVGVNPRLAESIALYSSAADYKQNLAARIRKLWFKPPFLPTPFSRDRRDTQKKLDPVLEEAKKVHKSNPLLQSPDLIEAPLNTRIHTYREVCAKYSKFIDFHFSNVGDYAYAVFCGPRAEEQLYGKPLNGQQNGFGIQANEQYPTEEKLTEVSRETQFFPFLLWNTRKVEFLKSHFDFAGEQLINIPPKWRSFFGIAMAEPCALSYREGNKDQVLDWCKQLDEVGKLETCKQIHKSLRNGTDSAVNDFAKRTEQHELPVIIDVLTGTIDSIDRDKQSATVVMETYQGERFSETIRLERLERAGIKFIETKFEYTVYRLPRGETAANIEPCVADDKGEDL